MGGELFKGELTAEKIEEGYFSLSRKLYNKNFIEGCESFICSPSTFLCKDLRRQTFTLIKRDLGNRALGQYLTDLENRPYNEKYLFILGLVFCISDNEAERTDKSYWKAFEQNISNSSINDNIRDQILSLISRFCKNHKIPFFDVYQHRNHRNICARIYSLVPFTETELLSLCYISEKEGITLLSDFTLLQELALTSYAPLFDHRILQQFRNGIEKLEALTREDVLSNDYSFSQLFSNYNQRYCEQIQAITLSPIEKERLDEQLKATVSRNITVRDFNVYFNFQDGAVHQIYLHLKGSMPGDAKFESMPLSIEEVTVKPRIHFEYQGAKKGITVELSKEYLVTGKPRNNGWHELELDYSKRVYENDIVGYSSFIKGRFQFHPTQLDNIPLQVKREYKNIYASAAVELQGGLAYYNDRYMWFAIPDIIIHNYDIRNVRMKLNENYIPNNSGRTLKEKFYRFLENRRQAGQFPLDNAGKEGYHSLSFWSQNYHFLSSIKIEQQNYTVEREVKSLQFTGCSVEKGAIEVPVSIKYDPAIFDYCDKREHLLFWISKFQEKGVSYERFRNAVFSVYFDQQILDSNPITRDLATITKRLIEQFIGLGFVRTSNVGSETRYIVNKARFISTHNGQLLYTGARSSQDMKAILVQDAGRVLCIDKSTELFQGVQMPSLLKYNTNYAGLIGIDNNEVINKFIKDGFSYDKKNHKSDLQSYALYLLNSYNLSLPEIAIDNPTIATNIGNYDVFDHSSLSFERIVEINLIQKGTVLQAREYNVTNRYIAGQKLMRDGEPSIQLFKILPNRVNDALYYFEAGTPARYLGWSFDEKRQTIYIPRRINVPNQVRQALQSCVGAYTMTYFTEPSTKKSFSPKLNKGRLTLSRKIGAGVIEVEAFPGITKNFIIELEQKLNLTIEKITSECSHP